MVESEITGIEVDLVNDDFEVSTNSLHNQVWSLGCDITIEDADTEIQEVKVNDIILSGNIISEEFSVYFDGTKPNYTDIDVEFIIGALGDGTIDGIDEIRDSLEDVENSIHDVTSSLVDINKALTGIGEESIQIKTTINGIQSQVNDIGTEMENKASVESVIEIGESVKEVQTNYAEQSIKVDALSAEIATKASAESVTTITDALTITNETLAEQVIRVDDVVATIETKAESSMVTEIADALTVTNEALASQQMTVDAMSAEIKTKAEASSVAELGESLTATNESLAEQIIKAENLSAEISNKASVESVTAIGDNLSAVTSSLAEQTLRVGALETEIATKASTESVTQIGDSLILANETLAQQVIKTDELGASIENLVSKETFLTTTGEFASELTSVKQTQQEISTTIQSQSGEITSIKENINGISVGIDKVEEELNSLSYQFDGIVDDEILTSIEKEQFFEIYRSIAKEHSTIKGNAFNYKIWKYASDGKTEESGINGGEGRYLKYVLFNNAYTPIVEIFTDDSWGFDKMGETTELESGDTVSLLKNRIDEYYTARGELLETFSAITAAIEEAQKNAEKTLADLTGILTPEEMYTQIGKGVVLSTIIATRDTEGNITAGMNASPSFSDDSGENHGRVVFVGGVKDINNLNDATYVVYEDGHVKMSSADISEYASIQALRLGLDEKVDVNDFQSLLVLVNNTVQTLAKMWKIEDGELVTSYPLRVHNNITADKEVAAGGVGEEGPSSGEGIDEDQLEDYLKEHEYVTKDEVADLIPDVDLSGYATTQQLTTLSNEIGLKLDKKASKEEVQIALADKASKDDVKAVDEKLDKAVTDLEKADKENADNITDLAGKLNDMFYLKDGTIGTKYNFYSNGEISAGGVGTESEGGGGEGSTTLDGLQDVEITGADDFPNTDEGRYQKQSQVLGYNSQTGIWVNKVTMYHHKQTQPSAEWNIKHDLGKFPNVKIVDTLKQLCLGDVYYIDENNVTIKFGGAESGDAYLD